MNFIHQHVPGFFAFAVIIAFGLVSVGTVRSAVSSFQDGIVVGGTTLTNGLLLEVQGKLGASEICDDENANCVTTENIYTVVSGGGGGGGGGIAGNGSPNYIAKFDSATSVVSSLIFDDGSNVGIDITPSQKLHVSGSIRADGRHLYLGSAQDIYGDNDVILSYDSNDVASSSFALRNASDDLFGYLSGETGDAFGLKDGDNNWFMRHLKGSSTDFYSSGNVVMSVDDLGVTALDFLYSSDKHLKENIEPINSALDIIKSLTGVYFDWKDSEKHAVGFIAQDVERVAPVLVEENSHGHKAVRYGNITAYLVEALKEQQAMIDSQQAEIAELRALINQD